MKFKKFIKECYVEYNYGNEYLVTTSSEYDFCIEVVFDTDGAAIQKVDGIRYPTQKQAEIIFSLVEEKYKEVNGIQEPNQESDNYGIFNSQY